MKEESRPKSPEWDVTMPMRQNADGRWVPSIPLPFYGIRRRCSCGRRFWTTAGYQGHYALVHILK